MAPQSRCSRTDWPKHHDPCQYASGVHGSRGDRRSTIHSRSADRGATDLDRPGRIRLLAIFQSNVSDRQGAAAKTCGLAEIRMVHDSALAPNLFVEGTDEPTPKSCLVDLRGQDLSDTDLASLKNVDKADVIELDGVPLVMPVSDIYEAFKI